MQRAINLNPLYINSLELKGRHDVKRDCMNVNKRSVGKHDEVRLMSDLRISKINPLLFGSARATCALQTKNPTRWRESYGMNIDTSTGLLLWTEFHIVYPAVSVVGVPWRW